MTRHENESLVREFYEQWNSGAIDFERLVHPDIANTSPNESRNAGAKRFGRRSRA